MALRRAHLATRTKPATWSGRKRPVVPPDPRSGIRGGSGERGPDDDTDTSPAAPPPPGPAGSVLPDELARLACEFIPLCRAPAHTEAFRAELLVHLRAARPDAPDRALALALIQIRLQLIACSPLAEAEVGSESH
jgi:hypothetical protein